jgi:acetoin utilization protein AcuB
MSVIGTVRAIMSTNVVTVDMDDSLGRVRDIFQQTRFHHLLVVEAKKLVGVISDRDLLQAISPNIGTYSETNKDLASLRKRAHQIMSRRPVTLQETAEIYDAVHIFNTHEISCIPIVDDDNRPVGIVSWRDILKALGATYARAQTPSKA